MARRAAHGPIRQLQRRDALVVHRIADGRFPLLDGEGAARYGGRWNSPGRRVVYASVTYAGAMLEVLVHANTGRVPRHHVAVALTIPIGCAVETLDVEAARGWDAADQVVSRDLGDAWLASRRSVALIVPSVVAPPHEANVLLNPAHSDFARIVATPPAAVRWDARLFREQTAPDDLAQPARRATPRTG